MLSNEPIKRVLIVDDEPNVAMILAENLESHNSGYQVETAENGHAALTKIRDGAYDLMITDYKMPGMDGLELARAARQIAPDLQIVLMTAFGTDNLRDAANKLRVDDFVEKPFSMEKIRKIVEQAVARARNANVQHSTEHSLDRAVKEQLQTLQFETGARCVVLLSSNGFPIETAGQTGGLDVTTVGILVAANFMAASELAKLLGKSSVFKSSYFESPGGTDNIYAYAIDQEFLLTVVFGAESKAGSVWFYTKQTATALIPLMAEWTTSTSFEESGFQEIGTGDARAAKLGRLMMAEEAIQQGILPAKFGQSERLSQAFDSEIDKLFDESPTSN